MSALTVIVLIPNAGDRLPRCLESVQWADDLFCIVDPKTSDGSDAVARRYSKHVVTHEYVNKANQCTWALAQIETEWSLVLDADEWVSDALRDRIRGIIADTASKDGYDIRRRSIFFRKEIQRCGWDRDYNVRLFRTRKGHYLDRRVHSKIVIDGSMGRIEELMYHDTYRTFEEYFTTFQRFTTWGAQDLFDAGRRANLSDLTLRPLIRFLKMYVLKQGFRDGLHGAVLCGLAACSVFTKYAKLWNLERLDREKRSG